jgi:short-subunit dehydrogenase/FAD/FMN-containing dehydrogenase
VGERPVLAYGCGRSYGDAAMNPGGRLIDCRDLDRFIAFDRATGVLTCEAGVTLADILAVACRPDADGSGWLLPVTPGTRFVTVGGAIANDVHGKNHHISGTFGTHVLSFELARGDGSRLVCSANDNSDLFAATIGGLGLTGLILSATIQMRRVSGLAVEAEDIRFDNLDGYFALAAESDAAWEYTAAWIDCLARGPHLGRGIFSRARHVPGRGVAPPPRQPRRSVPMVPPVSLITPWTVRIFNAAYWRRLGSRGRSSQVGSYEKAFFPLDALGHWNRIYGPRGFYQFQCQLPTEGLRTKLRELLEMVAESGQASMLTTLKLFGDRPSPGLLSFPAPGATLALDFANRGASTLALLGRLERKVRDSGGRLYAAKDGVMAAETFHAGYPRVGRFLPHIDPIFASAFARRVALISTAVLESVPMNERLSRSQTVAIFGATSDIAIAVARCYAESGCRLILIGRDANSLAVLAADLGVRGSPETHILLADFSDLQGLPALASRAWDRIGGIHLALVAYGTMSVQQEAEQNAPTAEIVLTVNFTSPAILLNELANRFQSQGHGTIAAITSVAGDRGRKSNYFYGSAKGGLQRLLEGLRHRMASAGVTVVDIRPGFVSTKMTAHLNRKGPLWASPERVAADIVKAITTGRMVCYTPGFWRLIMLIVRSVPRFLFHRTSL